MPWFAMARTNLIEIRNTDMKYFLPLLIWLLPVFSAAQIDPSFLMRLKSLDTANILRLDTLSAPEDMLTHKIRQLLGEKKGLTVATIVQIKIADEQQKDTVHSKEFYDKLSKEMTAGTTGRLLENSVINLYRRTFTESEVDELISFYKTSAGHKMESEYLFMMVESVKDAEQLLKLALQRVNTR
jgi:uncharacterized protein